MTNELEQKIEEMMSSEEYGELNQLVKLGKRAVPHLIQILEKSDPLMQKRAAVALGKIRDKTAIKPLIQKLSDKDPTVLIIVVNALVSFGDKEVSNNILPLLKNRDLSVRLHTIRALGQLQAKNATPQLIELIEKEEHDFIRKEASKALRKIENIQ